MLQMEQYEREVQDSMRQGACLHALPGKPPTAHVPWWQGGKGHCRGRRCRRVEVTVPVAGAGPNPGKGEARGAKGGGHPVLLLRQKSQVLFEGLSAGHER